jgi:hypothetical protein
VCVRAYARGSNELITPKYNEWRLINIEEWRRFKRVQTTWIAFTPRYNYCVLIYDNGSILKWLLTVGNWRSKKKSYRCNRPWRPIGLWDVEGPTFSLDNRLTDDGKVVSLTHRPPFTSSKIHGTHFCLRLSRTQSHNTAGKIRYIEKKIHLIRIRTRDLPVCSIVPQPTTLPR